MLFVEFRTVLILEIFSLKKDPNELAKSVETHQINHIRADKSVLAIGHGDAKIGHMET